MLELQRKIVRIGEGDFDVAVGFSNRNDEIGDLGRSFNQMVQQLCESLEKVERQHRAQMSRAECFATLGEFAAGLAHEIRNPLAGIAGVIEIVGRDLPLSSPACAVVKDVRLEIAQINHILTNFLQTARPHLPEVCSTDLNITVEHAVVLACQQVLSALIKIELQKDPNLPTVEHDRGQISQLLLNLLLNAVQAIDGAGAIRVEISLLKGDAAITVVDTGRGIAPEHLPNIFRPFYTTKGNGTGIH
jgi:two-component system NtrC family sensor kinase